MERNLFTFGDLAVSNKLKKIRKANVLVRIHKLVDWNKLKTLFTVVDSRNTSHYGRDCYDPLAMFKVLFLQALYNFSDRDIEEHLHFNILFMQFCGFSIDSDLPDHSTIARWRDRFIDKNVYDKAFNEINNQLESKGLELKNAMIVDASLVISKSRPFKKVIVEVEAVGDDALEEAGDPVSPETTANIIFYEEESKDSDARWLKKGKKSYYGYKQHVSVNKNGYINGLITTPANVSDTKMLAELITLVKPPENTGVYGDKAYLSKKNSSLIEINKLKNHLMIKHKSKYNKDESVVQLNKTISKVRYVVERTFGCLKQNLGGSRSRYVGIAKTHNFNLIRAITHNLIRATNHVFEPLCLT